MKFRFEKEEWKWNIVKKYAFFGCAITGFLTYFYTMTHHFLTYDSMWNQYSRQDMISSGRQFLTYACRISSDYDLPWVNGVLSILYLALAAVILTDVFQIKYKLSAVLIGALLVAFPSVSATFCYSYTIDGYMLAVLLTTLAFFLTRKYRFGMIPAIFLVGFSLGVYQAYYSYLILLCILTLLLDFIYEDQLKKIIQWAVRYLIMGIGGYAFYVISLKLMLLFGSEELSGYQGTDKIMGFSIRELPRGLYACVRSFASFIVHKGPLTSNLFMRLAFYLVIVLALAAYGYLFIKSKKDKTWVRMLGVMLLFILLPFAANIISILSPEAFFHVLMRYPWVLFFVFAVVIAEKFSRDFGTDRQADFGQDPENNSEKDSEKAPGTDSETAGREDTKKNRKKILSAVLWTATAFLIFEFAVMANIVAFNMNERYEKTYAACIRIADRLEQTPGYEQGMPVAILGGLPNESYYPKTDITEEVLKGYFGCSGDLCVDSTDKYEVFMSHYLNVTINGVDNKTEMELVKTEKFKQMDTFPYAGCIQLIDGIWVVKING